MEELPEQPLPKDPTLRRLAEGVIVANGLYGPLRANMRSEDNLYQELTRKGITFTPKDFYIEMEKEGCLDLMVEYAHGNPKVLREATVSLVELLDGDIPRNKQGLTIRANIEDWQEGMAYIRQQLGKNVEDRPPQEDYVTRMNRDEFLKESEQLLYEDTLRLAMEKGIPFREMIDNLSKQHKRVSEEHSYDVVTRRVQEQLSSMSPRLDAIYRDMEAYDTPRMYSDQGDLSYTYFKLFKQLAYTLEQTADRDSPADDHIRVHDMRELIGKVQGGGADKSFSP